jgi:hypothetical protein
VKSGRVFLLSLVLAIAVAFAFAKSATFGMPSDTQHAYQLLSLPGFIGIFAAVLICSVAAGSTHGGGDLRVVAFVSVFFNTGLFWLFLTAFSWLWNRATWSRENKSNPERLDSE